LRRTPRYRIWHIQFAPFLPTSHIIGDRFDTLAKAPRIELPTIVVHGELDEVIPIAMGRAVSAAIHGAKLLTVPNGHHNDLLLLAHSLIIDAVAALAARVHP